VRLLLILRAAVCLEVGLIVTFSQSHSVQVGLLALTSFGVGYAMVSVFTALLQRKKLAELDSVVVTALALVVGLAAANTPADQDHLWFRYLVVGWGILSGAYDLFKSRKLGYKTPRGKEYMVSSVLALALGLLFLFVQLDEVGSVGFFGAYMILCAVHFGISAASETTAKA
jgi:hypothetical protein